MTVSDRFRGHGEENISDSITSRNTSCSGGELISDLPRTIISNSAGRIDSNHDNIFVGNSNDEQDMININSTIIIFNITVTVPNKNIIMVAINSAGRIVYNSTGKIRNQLQLQLQLPLRL